MKTAFSITAMALASLSFSFTDVVPNGYATTEANLTFLLSSTSAGGRTYQLVLDESQLTSFVGSNLNGLAFRLNGSASTNFVGTTFTQFDIYLGAGVDPTIRSTTFADNFTVAPTLVRSGALNFPSLTSGGSPNAFGPTIGFSDYLYTGGDLTVELRYSPSSSSGPSLDAVGNTQPGYNTLFGAGWSSSSTATTVTGSANANFFVMELSADPVPEPATMAILGLGAAALIRKRKS